MKAWLREMLQISVQTSDSSSGQTFSTHPGMLSGHAAFHVLVLFVSAELMMTSGRSDGGVSPAFPLVVMFDASK